MGAELINFVDWKTAAEVMKMLVQQNELVSGMGVAEAAAVLGFTKTAGGMYIKTVITTAATSITGSTAAAVAPLAAGTTTTAANLVLYESAAGTAAVGGLATVALPIAVGMLGAASGYLIGTELNKNPEYDNFMDRLLFPAFDFITGNNYAESLYNDYVGSVPEATTTIPMIFDADGNTFMDSRASNAVANFLNSLISPDYVIPFFGACDWLVTTMVWNLDRTIDVTVSFRETIESTLRQPLILVTAVGPTGIGKAHIYTFHSLYFDTHVLAVNNSGIVQAYNKDGTGSTEKFDYLIVQVMNTTPSTLGGGPKQVLQFAYELLDTVLVNKGITIYSSIASYLAGDAPILADIDDELPSQVVKYLPGLGAVPSMKFPELPDWLPVFLPNPPLLPGTIPEPLEVPEFFPADYPDKINPFINPYQPQPLDIPIKKPDPTKIPSIPLIPVPNPNTAPDVSTAPYPKPDPSKDPSQLAMEEPITEQVPETVEPIIDSGGVSAPVLPVMPTISSSATGLLHVYNPTAAQISEFGTWLWTTFSGDLIETLSKMFNNPMDAVIGLHELYATPITSDDVTIKAGYLDSGVTSRLVASRYTEIKCGALSVPEFWGNYLDYTPYTKTYCYLPFIGVVELNADDIIGSGVEITYRIDTYNGSCIALITTAKAGSSEGVTYEFSGNCSVELPITSGMKTAVQSALIGAATTAIAASTGGASLLGSALIGGVRGANTKNLVQHSGSFGSSYGAMGIKIPFIIVKRPQQKVVPGYSSNYGYPAHKMVRISECSGYLRAIEVEVISPTAIEVEKKMIETALKSGVFID